MSPLRRASPLCPVPRMPPVLLRLPFWIAVLGACDPGVQTREGKLVEVPVESPADSGGETTPPEVEAPPLQPLDAPRLLRRISLDLRGTLPTAAELDAVAADPAALDSLIEAYLADPALRERMVDLLAEQWWTRVDEFDVRYEDYDLRATEEFPFERSVGEEPLRLAAHVIAEDLPWSEVVTADYTVANEVLGALWPLDYPAGETGWKVTRYTDDRPAAGALATNGLWWRYTTTPSNMNRGRASALSRIFLCVDYIARPINFSAASTDLADPEEAIRTDPYCLNCHSSLDPIAASFFGFWWRSLYSRIEEDRYHPEREVLAEETLGLSPAWFGEPISGLAELGPAVASDPRFTSCAVETLSRGLLRRSMTPEDQAQLEALRRSFLEGGSRPKALLRAILATPHYRAAAVDAGADAAWEARESTARLLSPEQLERSLAEATGLDWTSDGFAQLRNDEVGYRILAGGVNGISVVEPQLRPNLTSALVARRAAEGAAEAAVQAAVADPAGNRLLPGFDPALVPGDPGFDVLLRGLAWRLHAQALDEADAAALSGLWATVAAADGPEAAWASLTSALLQDPLFLTY